MTFSSLEGVTPLYTASAAILRSERKERVHELRENQYNDESDKT